MKLTTWHDMIFGFLIGYVSAVNSYHYSTWQFYIIVSVGYIIWLSIGKLNNK